MTSVASQIQIKENRIEKAKSVKDFKLCDQLYGDVRVLLREKRENEKQLAALKKVEAKSKWYHKRKSSTSHETLNKPPEKVNRKSDILHKSFKKNTEDDTTKDASGCDNDICLSQQPSSSSSSADIFDVSGETNIPDHELVDETLENEEVNSVSSHHSGASADTVIVSPPSSPLPSSQPF